MLLILTGEFNMDSYDIINKHAGYIEYSTGIELSRLTIDIHTILAGTGGDYAQA